jgi:hypothetical protein
VPLAIYELRISLTSVITVHRRFGEVKILKAGTLVVGMVWPLQEKWKFKSVVLV